MGGLIYKGAARNSVKSATITTAKISSDTTVVNLDDIMIPLTSIRVA